VGSRIIVCVDSKAFSTLGDVVPEALGQAEQSARTVTARLKAANAIARQLRCRHELLAEERVGLDGPHSAFMMKIDGEITRSLGDEVLEAEQDDVLRLLADRLREHRPLSKRIQESWQQLRSIYGYDSPEWTERPNDRRLARRVVARIAVCLATDATFAPYARGLLNASVSRQASLRVDLRSAARTIWAWASDYPALARCLAVARTGIDHETVTAFPALSALFHRVLSDHLPTGAAVPNRGTEIREVADTAGALATRDVALVAIPGRTSSNISSPLIHFVAVAHPDWMTDDQEEDAEEVFARGAAPLVFEGLIQQRRSAEIVEALDALSRAMQSVEDPGRNDA
jgi:hypothetical protein